MRAVLLASALAASLVLSGCSSGDNEVAVPSSTAEGVQVQDGRLVLPLVKDGAGAIYLNLVNDSDQPKKILSIDVAGVDMTMVHETLDKGGVSSMQMVENAVVPAHGNMVFAPGGRHIMLMGLKPDLKAGGSALLKVNFEGGAFVAAAIPVVPAAAELSQ